MKLQCFEIQNFRRLKSVRISMTKRTTVFVGANNSGKTSAMSCLRMFLIDRRAITLRDFTLSNIPKLNLIGETWESKENSPSNIDDWENYLPSLDVWLDVADHEIHHVSHILPSLNWDGGLVGVRLKFEPKDVEDLWKTYRAARKSADELKHASLKDEASGVNLNIWPSDMADFLAKTIHQHFKVRSYILDPSKFANTVNGIANPQQLPTELAPIEVDPFEGLIKIHQISAQRGFSDPGRVNKDRDQESSSRTESSSNTKLSAQLRSYFDKHVDPLKSPTIEDLAALGAISTAQDSFDDRLRIGFADAIDELQGLGYPGLTDPRLTISTKLALSEGLNHEAAVQYSVGKVEEDGTELKYKLPEDYSGLGYQNLISMTFTLIGFRDAWLRTGKLKRSKTITSSDGSAIEPLHLVLLEEPEAYLHAQVQQVFIRKAYDVLQNNDELKNSKLLSTQLLISTHSSHIAHEVSFASLRHFRRQVTTDESQVPTSIVIDLTNVFGSDDETSRFVTRYLKATYCDLFFADAAIFVEGPAERILVPSFIRSQFEVLRERYITLIEIGGSHAHRFRKLVEELGLTTLIISDIDAVAKNENNRWSSVLPAKGAGQMTGNQVLATWHPEKKEIDSLYDLKPEDQIKNYSGFFSIFVAFQRPVTITYKQKKAQVLPSTFEDALAFENLEVIEGMEGGALAKKFSEMISIHSNIDALAAGLFDMLKSGAKAEFAMDVLCLLPEDLLKLKAPPYILDGLVWLEKELTTHAIDHLIPSNPPDAENAVDAVDAVEEVSIVGDSDGG